jgi:hypothetical protein
MSGIETLKTTIPYFRRSSNESTYFWHACNEAA